jgi:hypothetical protein
VNSIPASWNLDLLERVVSLPRLFALNGIPAVLQTQPSQSMMMCVALPLVEIWSYHSFVKK